MFLLKGRELPLGFSDHKVAEIGNINMIDTKKFNFGMIATDLNRLRRGIGRTLVYATEDLARHKEP